MQLSAGFPLSDFMKDLWRTLDPSYLVERGIPQLPWLRSRADCNNQRREHPTKRWTFNYTDTKNFQCHKCRRLDKMQEHNEKQPRQYTFFRDQQWYCNSPRENQFYYWHSKKKKTLVKQLWACSRTLNWNIHTYAYIYTDIKLEMGIQDVI